MIFYSHHSGYSTLPGDKKNARSHPDSARPHSMDTVKTLVKPSMSATGVTSSAAPLFDVRPRRGSISKTFASYTNVGIVCQRLEIIRDGHAIHTVFSTQKGPAPRDWPLKRYWFGLVYRIRFTVSWESPSVTVITREFAWKARWVMMSSLNCVPKSTLDPSSTPPDTVPLPPVLGRPI